MYNKLSINQIKALVHSTYTRDNRINLYDNIENILYISNKIIENPSIVILHRISDKVILIKSNQDGIISHINALKVGELSVKLGAGRITKDSKIDYSVGIKLLKQSGDLVKKDDIIAKLYVNDLNIKLTKDDINFYSVK